MGLKNTKIYIPEIPKEWSERVRSGHTNIWNYEESNEIKLNPPSNGLYAERFDDGWYWVCGCNKCLENGESYSYIVCEEHNRCVDCGIHRSELDEIPWGGPYGFTCKPCDKKEREKLKEEALLKAERDNHSEIDCFYLTKIICPVCASEHSEEDFYEDGEHEASCYVCDTDFIVEVEFERRFTSSMTS